LSGGIDMKKWRFTADSYTSPMLPLPVYKDHKARIIREKIDADFDEGRHIIKIPVGEKAKENLEKLQRLRWV
jgi:hypothetical protein